MRTIDVVVESKEESEDSDGVQIREVRYLSSYA